jgi:hypothetical protein
MVADDEEVTLEHTVEMYRSLPDAELAIIPGTSHGLLHEKLELCNTIIGEFLTADPISTIAPVRRAKGSQSGGRSMQAQGALRSPASPRDDVSRTVWVSPGPAPRPESKDAFDRRGR